MWCIHGYLQSNLIYVQLLMISFFWSFFNIIYISGTVKVSFNIWSSFSAQNFTSQTTQLQQRRADPLLHPLPHPHQEPYIMNEAREQEAFWRVARKYGFCETCGREKLHDQVCEPFVLIM